MISIQHRPPRYPVKFWLLFSMQLSICWSWFPQKWLPWYPSLSKCLCSCAKYYTKMSIIYIMYSTSQVCHVLPVPPYGLFEHRSFPQNAASKNKLKKSMGALVVHIVSGIFWGPQSDLSNLGLFGIWKFLDQHVRIIV